MRTCRNPRSASEQHTCRRPAQQFKKHRFPDQGTNVPGLRTFPLAQHSRACQRGNTMALIRRGFLCILGAIATICPAVSPTGAQDYPRHPVTIVVPFTPAGTTDILARLLGQKLEQRLGRSFIIENRPGAGTLIAASAVAKAAPDGYTLLMAPSSTMAVNVTLYKHLPYDPVTELVPLAGLARVPFVLIVNPSLPVHSLSELIKYAKERPGQLSFASVGPGVPHHLYAEMLMNITGIQMTYVPYKGSAPALNDVVGGHIPLMFGDFAPALGMLRAGKVRPLGVTSGTRVAAFPDIPTMIEAGVPEFGAMQGWQMLVAPSRTPPQIVDRLHSELTAALALPDVANEITRQGMLPFEKQSVAELRDLVRSEIVRWGKVVQLAGIAGSE